MISSNNKHVFIHDLSDLTLKGIIDALWASMNVGSKHPITWNNCRHITSWQFYLHWRIQETGSPGIIYIVCHQVLRNPSEQGTSSMGKHLLATAYIAKLNQLTESQVTELTSSMVDETSLAIRMRQGSRGITIVSLQRKVIYDIHINRYWSKWQTKCSKVAAKDFENSEFHQDTWNRYLMLQFVVANIQRNTISDLELTQSYEALRSDIVLPSTTTYDIIWQREYALTVVAIKKQLPSRNSGSLVVDRQTSTNKLAIMLVIAYYMDQNRALGEVQLAFYDVDCVFISAFESYLWMIGQQPTDWSNASWTYEGRSGLFSVYQLPFTSDYNRECFLKLLDDMHAAINTWGLCTLVACIEEPHTMHGVRHTTGFRCIHEQSQCQ